MRRQGLGQHQEANQCCTHITLNKQAPPPPPRRGKPGPQEAGQLYVCQLTWSAALCTHALLADGTRRGRENLTAAQGVVAGWEETDGQQEDGSWEKGTFQMPLPEDRHAQGRQGGLWGQS